jgi:uncharacterized protein YndB with AHSA1/START domain
MNWSSFKLRIPINAPVDEVYRRWSSSAGLLSWFLREADFKTNEGIPRPANDPLRPGDSYLWRWHGYRDDVTEQGTILSANHTDGISFSFGKAGNVSVKIYTVKDMTMCELEQDNIPTDEQGKEYYYIGCSKGWLFYLTNLKSVLEGGIDLRNRDIELQDVISS